MAVHCSSPAAAVEDTLVSSLIHLMERGTAPWRREWDSQRGGHHVNLISGRPYRGANPIVLTIGLHQRGATLPYWCGAAEARAHGLWPQQGSKAVTVLRPQVKRSRISPQGHANNPNHHTQGQTLKEDDPNERTWVRYRPVSLFNAQDLEGEALAGLIAARQAADTEAKRAEPERFARAQGVLQSWPVPLSQGGTRALYNPHTDHIHLPDRGTFHSSSAFYATWAHEALHSTGHPSRLGRDLSGAIGSQAYAREELLAELGAVLLGDRLEIGSDVSNHAAYLAEWIRLLRESPQLLYKLLSEARRAVDLICPLATGAEAKEKSGSTLELGEEGQPTEPATGSDSGD
jgi:antirestriction protein ArdC